MAKKALFAVSTLGLGHATRTLPIIKHYLQKKYSIDIVSYGNALHYLQSELQEHCTQEDLKINFLELRDYPALERGSGISFYFMLISDLITTCYRIWRETYFLKKLEEKTDYRFIFSDGKYGFASKKTKSYLLTHQLSFEIPKVFSFSQKIMDYFNQRMFARFNCVFIPDYADPYINLAGKLSHPKRLKKINVKYIGIISSLAQAYESKKTEYIDYLFTISGYLFEYKESFIQKLLQEAKELPGKKVFLLGDSRQKDYHSYDVKHNIEIYGFLAGKERQQKFHQAKIIISRAGYTTIMDLVELQKPAILFPTPHQTEQEYLAKYLGDKKYFACGEETSQLQVLLKKLKYSQSFNPRSKTTEALKTIYTTIDA